MWALQCICILYSICSVYAIFGYQLIYIYIYPECIKVVLILNFINFLCIQSCKRCHFRKKIVTSLIILIKKQYFRVHQAIEVFLKVPNSCENMAGILRLQKNSFALIRDFLQHTVNCHHVYII